MNEIASPILSEAARLAEFPSVADCVYMNVAARGLLPRRSQEAVHGVLADQAHGRVDKDGWFAMAERTRAAFARLIGASADEIAFTKNISEGLNIVAASLDWRAGDNAVMCSELEHPNNIFLWYKLVRERGIEVREIPARDGAYPIDEMIAAIDARTRLVTLSIVPFGTGMRPDVARLGAACRGHGAFLLGDGAQSVGILETDVEALGLDGLAVSTQKGLLALYGMGFLYCRRAWAERLIPAYIARFGVDLGDTHEADRGDADFDLMPGARRFDLGNHNFPAIAAVEQSIDFLQELGPERIEAHVVQLAMRLSNGLAECGIPLLAKADGPRSGIVCAGRLGSGGHDTTDDPAMAALYEALNAAGIRLSIRQGMLRFSVHVYNTAEEVDRIVDLVRGWRG